MHQSEASLPGIKKIYRVDIEELPENVVSKALVGIAPPIMARKTEVGFFMNATCVCDSDVINNGMVESVSFEFETIDDIILKKPTGWLIKDVRDNWWLIGSKEELYPEATSSRDLGNETKAAIVRHSVKWTAKKALIACFAVE